MEEPKPEDQESGGWTAPYWNDELQKMQHDLLMASDALLLGRVTYEGFAAVWPSFTDPEGFAERMNAIPKFVASRTLHEPLEWNANLIPGDTLDEVAKLKQEPGQDLLIYGSGELVRSLMRRKLIDEYRLMIHPILLGRGKRLFTDDADRSGLALTGSVPTATGVITLIYGNR
jgi:dihydrofolate reductase